MREIDYEKRAAFARQEAEDSWLPHVRARALRSAERWQAMADRAKRSEEMRAEQGGAWVGAT